MATIAKDHATATPYKGGKAGFALEMGVQKLAFFSQYGFNVLIP
jgi:hypothetical protein